MSLCCRTIPVTLVLRDPLLPDQDLGSLELAVTLMPKNSPMEEQRDAAVGVHAQFHFRVSVSRAVVLVLVQSCFLYWFNPGFNLGFSPCSVLV